VSDYKSYPQEHLQILKFFKRTGRAIHMERVFIQIHQAINSRNWKEMTQEERDKDEALRDRLFPEFGDLLKDAPSHGQIQKQAIEKAAKFGFPLADVIDALLMVWLKGGANGR